MRSLLFAALLSSSSRAPEFTVKPLPVDAPVAPASASVPPLTAVVPV